MRISGAAAAIRRLRHFDIRLHMNVQKRNNVRLSGSGDNTMVFAHGFGCDQTMWRLLAPSYSNRFKTVAFDLVGSGASDLAAYDRRKYSSLHGYAADLLEIVEAFSSGPVVFVGHSVSATIGMLAAIKSPELFSALVMVGPSPCLVNDGDYVGGFDRNDVDELLDTMEGNYFGWSSNLAPVVMGAPSKPDLSTELAKSFSRNDPAIAEHFARVAFLADHRADVEKCATPTLILQNARDVIAPIHVGEFLNARLPRSVLRVIDNVGHYPHLSAPSAVSTAIDEFLARALE